MFGSSFPVQQADSSTYTRLAEYLMYIHVHLSYYKNQHIATISILNLLNQLKCAALIDSVTG